MGAGPNGLVCAVRLARAGFQVEVVEAGNRPGGSVISAEETLPGFVHDLGAGFFPLAVASPAFRGLGLEKGGIEWINPPIAMAHPFADGRAVSLCRSLEGTVSSLDAVAPRAGEAWRSVIEPLWRHRGLVIRSALAPFPPLRAGPLLALRLGRHGTELGRLMLGSAAGFGAAVFGRDEPTAWLAGSVAHSDLDPGAAGGAALGLFLHFLGHVVGWPFPAGGAGRITEALVGRLEEAGGSLTCNDPVERVVCYRGEVSGVRLAGGRELGADAVVACVSVRPFLSMVPDGALPGRLERRLRRWRYGLGTFKLDLALDGPVPWASEEARSAGVVQLGDTLEHQLRAACEARLGRVPGAPTMVVGQHSLHDPSRAPTDGHTLYVYTHVPQRPELPEEEIADRIEARIEDFAPGFRRLIRARAIRSPQRLEQENSSLVGGDLGGGSSELDQQLVFRPDPALVRYRTPIHGLYLAGSSVHPGPGVHGVCGAGAANAVIADRSVLRPLRQIRLAARRVGRRTQRD